MLRINNVQVYGLEESIIASGYPMRTDLPCDIEDNEEHWLDHKEYEKDVKRASSLGNAKQGSGHDNWLSGCIVQFDVTYPAYWSMQFQRYHFMQIISSQSKMHKLKELDLDTCFNEYVHNDVKMLINAYQRHYNEKPTQENFMRLISNCPMGLELTMRVSTNYLQLKTIYTQRKSHKLEDWKIFCDWILTLPMFKELVLKGE